MFTGRNLSIRSVSLGFIAVFAVLCAVLLGYALEQYQRTERASRAIISSVEMQAKLYSAVQELSRERHLSQLAMVMAEQGPLRGLSHPLPNSETAPPVRTRDIIEMLRRQRRIVDAEFEALDRGVHAGEVANDWSALDLALDQRVLALAQLRSRVDLELARPVGGTNIVDAYMDMLDEIGAKEAYIQPQNADVPSHIINLQKLQKLAVIMRENTGRERSLLAIIVATGRLANDDDGAEADNYRERSWVAWRELELRAARAEVPEALEARVYAVGLAYFRDFEALRPALREPALLRGVDLMAFLADTDSILLTAENAAHAAEAEQIRATHAWAMGEEARALGICLASLIFLLTVIAAAYFLYTRIVLRIVRLTAAISTESAAISPAMVAELSSQDEVGTLASRFAQLLAEAIEREQLLAAEKAIAEAASLAKSRFLAN